METNKKNETEAVSRGRFYRNRFYTEAKNERQTYDLAIPADAFGSTGLILCIHGGGWIVGDKESYAENLKQASETYGFAAAAMNYRYVSETVCFGDILDDITAALSAIKAQGAACGVCFDRVLLTGISAGGHLSLLYAYAKKESAPITPVCVVSLCGPTDLSHAYYYSEENAIARAEGMAVLQRMLGCGVGCSVAPKDFEAAVPAIKKYSPVSYVDAHTVPTVFGHGEQDEIVPYQNALDLDAKLTACGVAHTFVSFPRSGHGCEDKASMQKMMALFFRCAETYLK